MDERNAGLEPSLRMELRLGVNLGDVIVDGTDIHGDGVNVAARLQQMDTSKNRLPSRS
jgi:class 3 adenylate cyclase